MVCAKDQLYFLDNKIFIICNVQLPSFLSKILPHFIKCAKQKENGSSDQVYDG
jgi:hypothetical protein